MMMAYLLRMPIEDAVVENNVAPDCVNTGSYDNVIYCTVCKVEISRETKVVEKLVHDYEDEWTTDLEPTCSTVGSKSHHCTRCDEKEDVTVIPAVGHTYDDDRDASCSLKNNSKVSLCITLRSKMRYIA
jgi:hypothetical protein